MAEFLEESTGLESTTIGIYRTAATVKGGRRFSFNALVAVGDRQGSVGLGYAKAPGVPAAIEKAQKVARKNLTQVTLQEGTIPHEVVGRFLSSRVKLVPASPGTGVIAGSTVRAVMEMAGVKDCLTKSMGSSNQKNLAKAVVAGLCDLRSKQKTEELRGLTLEHTVVEEKLEAGRRFAPAAVPEAEKAKGPQAKKEDKKGKGKGKGKPSGKREEKAASAEAPKPQDAQPSGAEAESDQAAQASEGAGGGESQSTEQ